MAGILNRAIDGVLKLFGRSGAVTALNWPLRRQLYEQAANQINNGLTLTEVLQDFRERLLRRRRNRSAQAIQHAYQQVCDGKTLMASLGRSLAPLERSVLSAGERAGQLPNAMRLVLDVREMTGRMTRQLRSSFVAPAVYLVSFYAALYVIGAVIVPQFTAVVPMKEWTGWAYVMSLMGQIAVGWAMPVVLTGLLLAAGWAIWAMPRVTSRGRAFLDASVFPFNTYCNVQGFAWLLSFSALLRAGVPDTDALRGQIETASPWMKSRLAPILTGLTNGLNLAAAMRLSGFNFPSMDLIDEIGAYAGFPNFSEKIEGVARQYAQTLEKQLIFKGAMISAAFTGLMFAAFIVLQLGANSLSSILSASMGK